MSKLVNVRAYLPWMRRVCSRRLVYDQLDNLEHDICILAPKEKDHVIERIAQIKKDVARIQA